MEKPSQTQQTHVDRHARAETEANVYAAFNEYALDCGLLDEDRPLQYLEFRANEMKGLESPRLPGPATINRNPLNAADVRNSKSGLDQRLLEFTRQPENLALQLDLSDWYPVIWRSWAGLRVGTRIVEQEAVEQPLGTLWLFECAVDRCGRKFERRLFNPAFGGAARQMVDLLLTQPEELMREFLPANVQWSDELEEFWIAFPVLVERLQCIAFRVGSGFVAWAAEAVAPCTVDDPLAGFAEAFHFCSVIAACVQFYARRVARECHGLPLWRSYDEDELRYELLRSAVEALGQMAYWVSPRSGEDPSCLEEFESRVFNPVADDPWEGSPLTGTYLRRVGDSDDTPGAYEYPARRLRVG